MINDARRVRLLLAEHLGNPDKRRERDAHTDAVLRRVAAWERRDLEQRWAVRYSTDGGRTFITEGPFTRPDAQRRLWNLLSAVTPLTGCRVEPWPEPPAA
jgi:hypothetical protein